MQHWRLPSAWLGVPDIDSQLWRQYAQQLIADGEAGATVVRFFACFCLCSSVVQRAFAAWLDNEQLLKAGPCCLLIMAVLISRLNPKQWHVFSWLLLVLCCLAPTVCAVVVFADDDALGVRWGQAMGVFGAKERYPAALLYTLAVFNFLVRCFGTVPYRTHMSLLAMQYAMTVFFVFSMYQ